MEGNYLGGTNKTRKQKHFPPIFTGRGEWDRRKVKRKKAHKEA